MKKTFVTIGDRTYVTETSNVGYALDKGVYTVQWNDRSGRFELARADSDTLAVPEKTYGSLDIKKRLLKIVKARPNESFAAMLHGTKGCGKTLEAKHVCNESGLPVILVREPFTGTAFTQFLEQLPKSVVFIDEFEKIYAENQARKQFLSVLDGVSQGCHVFLMTSNDRDIGEFFLGRPGRIRYSKHYGSVGKDVASEILLDRLDNPDHLESCMSVLKAMSSVSFDTLVCIADECNIFDEPATEFIDLMNIERFPSKWWARASVKGVDYEGVVYVDFLDLDEDECSFYLGNKDTSESMYFDCHPESLQICDDGTAKLSSVDHEVTLLPMASIGGRP